MALSYIAKKGQVSIHDDLVALLDEVSCLTDCVMSLLSRSKPVAIRGEIRIKD